MTAPLTLSVPAPTLVYTPLTGTLAPFEDVVTVRFGAVSYPDGVTLAKEDLTGGFALLSRIAAGGATTELWDAATKTWRAAGVTNPLELTGIPVVPPTTGAAPWDGLVIAVGAKDAAGVDQFAVANIDFPQYRLRGLFRAKRDGVEATGIGAESAPLKFSSVAKLARATVELTPGLTDATRLRIALRGSSMNPIGMIDIDASAGNAAVTISNIDASGAALAAITLQADGSIRIAPASGRKVVIDGDLEVERVIYLPSAAGLAVPPKKALP